MSDKDRRHWDARYNVAGVAPVRQPFLPPGFASFEHLFPTEGIALELACGRGRSALWLAIRGMEVLGVDVSPVAVNRARELVSHSAFADRCRFEVVDLDGGLPEGPLVDLLICHCFRNSRLDREITNRLAPGGLLAVAVMSEVAAGPGRFRFPPGELSRAFDELELVVEREGDGMACILARRSRSPG